MILFSVFPVWFLRLEELTSFPTPSTGGKYTGMSLYGFLAGAEHTFGVLETQGDSEM